MAPDYTKYIYFLLKRGTKTKFIFFFEEVHLSMCFIELKND